METKEADRGGGGGYDGYLHMMGTAKEDILDITMVVVGTLMISEIIVDNAIKLGTHER